MRISIVLFLFLFSFGSYGQHDEFEIHKNGLMYNEVTMSNLRNISDSLNLKYLQCDIDYTYYACKQTIGDYVSLNSGDIESAKKDMAKGVSIEEFVAKYPQAKVEQNLIIVQFQHSGHDGKNYVDFEGIIINDGWNRSIDDIPITQILSNGTNKWVVKHYEKNSFSSASIDAFYCPNKFTSQTIPEKYANMIGYSNCMIDTTASKIAEEAEYGHIDLPENWKNRSTQEKNNLLNSFRHTRVIGSCSQDASPRIHAKNIAILSSEVANWNVFLKAHLDIMNDRFERASDGSYAWSKRKTYLKELEELNINTLDLLFGISFRIENHSKHHYFGSPTRLGRALVDSDSRENAEILMTSMIEDERLDLYNRVVVYYTYRSYLSHLENEKIKKLAERRLKKSISSFPDYIKNKISF